MCHLLEVWVQDYPHDFAVGAAADALNALVKSIVTKTHLLHYGTDLLPFLEGRPLQDKDFTWAMQVNEPTTESDEPYTFSEDDDDVVTSLETTSSRTLGSEDASSTQSLTGVFSRERKSSLPLSARSNGTATSDHVDSVKDILKSLLNTSARLSVCEPLHVAEEITRVGKTLFLLIEVGTSDNLYCVAESRRLFLATGLVAARVSFWEERPRDGFYRTFQRSVRTFGRLVRV